MIFARDDVAAVNNRLPTGDETDLQPPKSFYRPPIDLPWRSPRPRSCSPEGGIFEFYLRPTPWGRCFGENLPIRLEMGRLFLMHPLVVADRRLSAPMWAKPPVRQQGYHRHDFLHPGGKEGK